MDVADSEKLGLTPSNDYAGYLRLDLLLAAQQPKSNHHDEPLFIIQHQTSELWMKLVVHELRASIKHVQADQLSPCFKILSRVKQIMRMMFEQWAVLETMTPSDYAQFRGTLGRASGFQSWQYRMIEFLLGNKDATTLEQLHQRPLEYEQLSKDLAAPSLYDEFWRFLSRSGFDIPAGHLERDFSLAYEPDEAVLPALQEIYEHPLEHWAAYEMCEKLLDVDQMFQLWRYRHMQTVERIIGYKQGTGKTKGATFLRERVKIQLFPELWAVRTHIRDVEFPDLHV